MTDSVNHICEALTLALDDTPINASPLLVIAYSGGVDSSLLLHAAYQFRAKTSISVHALHVHHALSKNADAWAKHCEYESNKLNIPFTLRRVIVNAGARKSVEAEARNARYEALHSFCHANNGVLCLGQHAEDQLETILLQLKRGAGPQGLSGMGAVQWRNGILSLRPMLALSKQDIVDTATKLQLQWVNDESNHDSSYDRNFLRNEILPALTARWPQLTKTASRSAQLCADQNQLVTEQAGIFLSECLVNESQMSGKSVLSLTERWQREVIRQWFIQRSTLLPSQAQLHQIQLMLYAKQDATPEVTFAWGKLARYNNDIYWVEKCNEPIPDLMSAPCNTTINLPWLATNIYVTSDLPDMDSVTIRTKVTGLRVTPQHANVSKLLKDWFKQWKVPVWQRTGVPIFYLHDKAIALIVKGNLIALASKPSGINITVIDS